MSETTMTLRPNLPGRLGDPELTLATDPRADPRMVAALEPLGVAGRAEPVPLDADSSLEDIRSLAALGEPGFEQLFDVLFAALPPVEGVESRTEVISGVDGNDISLYIHRPTGDGGPYPGILHIHGGGMVILSAAGASYRRWRDELAARRLVVVGVEFRNAAGALGSPSVPRGPQRLHLGDGMDARPPGRPRRVEAGRVGGVRRRQPHAGQLAQGPSRRPSRNDRRRLRPSALTSPALTPARRRSCRRCKRTTGTSSPTTRWGTSWRHTTPAGRTSPIRLPGPGMLKSRTSRACRPMWSRSTSSTRCETRGSTTTASSWRQACRCTAAPSTEPATLGDLLLPGAMPEVYAASARDLATFAQHTLSGKGQGPAVAARGSTGGRSEAHAGPDTVRPCAS